MEKAMENKNGKKTIETLELEVIRFEAEDVIIVSGGEDNAQG